MPELPEVKITAERLNSIIKNKTLFNIKILSGRYTKKLPAGFSEFSGGLPVHIDTIGSKGKLMYITATDSSGKQWTILNTFGLTGEWTTEPNEHARVAFIFTKAKISNKNSQGNSQGDLQDNSQDNSQKESITENVIPHSPKYLVKLKNNFRGILYFADTRNFGTFIFSKDPTILTRKLSSLGIDPTLTKLTIGGMAKLINQKRNKDKTIYEFLMNQKNIAGVGNYLSHEILYLARISPLRKVNKLDNKDIRNIIIAVRYKIKQAYIYQNGKYDIFPGIKPKKFKFSIYNKDMCPKGHTLKANNKLVKGRTIHWCPVEQI